MEERLEEQVKISNEEYDLLRKEGLNLGYQYKDKNDVFCISVFFSVNQSGEYYLNKELAERIKADLAIVDKRRAKPGLVSEMRIIGDVKGRICLIVDDICDTAGTLVKAVDLLLNNGAIEVHAYISHGVLSNPAVDRIESSNIKSLVVTDSIEPSVFVKKSTKIRVVPASPMLAQAMLNIAHGSSVSSLFDDETLGPIYEAYYPE